MCPLLRQPRRRELCAAALLPCCVQIGLQLRQLDKQRHMRVSSERIPVACKTCWAHLQECSTLEQVTFYQLMHGVYL